jgi:hypothetical protein
MGKKTFLKKSLLPHTPSFKKLNPKYRYITGFSRPCLFGMDGLLLKGSITDDQLLPE